MERFDVIVVGARCAGSPLATFLARAGLDVCVLDRAQFPSDTPSTHGIQPTGTEILDRLGVLEPLLRTTTPIVRGTVAFDEVRVAVDDLPGITGSPMVSARRVTLDELLVQAAAEAGADVRTGTAVEDLVVQDGRVTGVKTATGSLHAPLVVGADGVRSSVARLVAAPEYVPTTSGRVFAWSYFEGANVDEQRVWLGRVGDDGYLALPSDAGLFMVAAVPSVEKRDAFLSDREGRYEATIRRWPELHACIEGARRVAGVRVMSHLNGYFRRSAGPGWALVGDAGHFKDPTPGQGISDALRQSVALATSIEDALGGARSPDAVLHDWWAWRDDDAWEMYWLAHDMGAPGGTPRLVMEVQHHIAADPRKMADLVRVLNHDLAPSKLLKPSMALSVAAKAMARGRGHRRELARDARDAIGDEIRRAVAYRRTKGSRRRMTSK